MLVMTNAPTPMAIPAMAPGLKLEPLLSGSVAECVDVGLVVLDESVVVFSRGTFMTDATEDA